MKAKKPKNGDITSDEDDDDDSVENDDYMIGNTPPTNEKKEDATEEEEELDENRLGIIPRTLILLFSEFEKSKEIAFFNVQIAIMEIYCEKLRDLIRPRMKLTLRYIGQNSKVDNLTYLVCSLD